jgi:hypothetical protein
MRSVSFVRNDMFACAPQKYADLHHYISTFLYFSISNKTLNCFCTQRQWLLFASKLSYLQLNSKLKVHFSCYGYISLNLMLQFLNKQQIENIKIKISFWYELRFFFSSKRNINFLFEYELNVWNNELILLFNPICLKWLHNNDLVQLKFI